ncbi:MAG: hypothetical protein RLZ10_581 [Bacteroidota bacterium]|jgi:RNA-binding protein YlmH
MSDFSSNFPQDLFLVTVKFTKQTETGEFKRVSEPFLIRAVTFGDAETKAFKYLDEQKIIGDIYVTAMKKENFNDLILNGSESFFKIGVTYLSTDDKKIKAVFLVEAEMLEQANMFLTEYLKNNNYHEFETVNASLTPIKAVV